jgi:hypothetical protein
MSDVLTLSTPGTKVRSKRRSPLDASMILWTLYLLSFPFYMIKSGLPQPSDFVIVLLAPVVLRTWKGNLFRSALPPLRALLAFFGYVVLVDLGYSVALNAWDISPKEGFVLTPTFYLFNGLVFLVAMVLYQRNPQRFVKVTLNAVLASVVLQAFLSAFVHRHAEGRATLFFNNPNQLGFFAVLSASILTFGRRQLGLSTTWISAGLVACAYIALLSASKAALGAIGILGLAGLVANPKTILLAGLALAVMILTVQPVMDALQAAQNRLQHPDKYGMVESRGYDRIANHEEYWLFGSGEGDYQRFADTTVIGSHELHSSGGTLFFCYGIVGSLLFLRFLWKCLQGSPFRWWFMLVPAFAYGMFHQGLRFTLLWVLLAMYVCLKNDARRPATSNLKPQRTS